MFSEYKIVKMSSSGAAQKKSKTVSNGRVLQEGYHIFFAMKLDEYRNNIQKLLDTLSNLSVAKVNRGVQETFLCGEIYCENRFQEAEETYPFFDLYFEQSQKWCDAVYRDIFR